MDFQSHLFALSVISGFTFDSDLVMRTHVKRTVSRCFSALRLLHQIRRSVPPATFRTLVVTLVLSRLDYGNGTLSGIPAYLLRRLQSVLNSAARMVCNLRRSDHITAALASLHWLSARERIDFKICVLTYRVIHGSAPSYLGPLVRVADLPGRRSLRSACTGQLAEPRVHLSTVGSHAFAVAAPHVWNSLPADVLSSPSLSIFRRRLKTFLFTRSYGADCLLPSS